MMFPEKTHIHIHSIEEFREVIRYYSLPENGEYYVDSLGERNCLMYPYIYQYTNRDTLLSARRLPKDGYNVLEYDEWISLIQASDFEPATKDELVAFIHSVNQLSGTLLEKIIKE